MVAVRVLSTYSSFLSTKLSLSNARVLSFLKWSQPITSGKHHGCVGGNGDDDNEDDKTAALVFQILCLALC